MGDYRSTVVRNALRPADSEPEPEPNANRQIDDDEQNSGRNLSPTLSQVSIEGMSQLSRSNSAESPAVSYDDGPLPVVSGAFPESDDGNNPDDGRPSWDLRIPDEFSHDTSDEDESGNEEEREESEQELQALVTANVSVMRHCQAEAKRWRHGKGKKDSRMVTTDFAIHTWILHFAGIIESPHS